MRFAPVLLETSAPMMTALLTSPPVVSTDTLAVCVALFTWALTVTMFGLAVRRASEALEKSKAFPVNADCSSSSRFFVNSCTGISVSLRLKMPMYVSGGKSFLMNSLTISIACGRVTGSMLWKTMQTVFTSRSGRDAPAVCPGFAWLSASRRCSSRPGTIRKLRTCWRTPSSKISTSPGLRFFTWRPFLSRTTRSSATSVVVTRIVGPGAAGVASCARPGPAVIATRQTRSGTPTFCIGQFYLFPQGPGGAVCRRRPRGSRRAYYSEVGAMANIRALWAGSGRGRRHAGAHRIRRNRGPRRHTLHSRQLPDTEQESARDNAGRRGAVGLRQRRLPGHLLRQRRGHPVATEGIAQILESPVPQQPRRHLHRRYGESRREGRGLRHGSRHRRLRQRWMAGHLPRQCDQESAFS